MSLTSQPSLSPSLSGETPVVPVQPTAVVKRKSLARISFIEAPKKIRKEWTYFNNTLRANITKNVIKIALFAAYRPKLHILFVVVLTLFLFTTGLVTNFNINVDFEFLFTPSGTRTAEQIKWFRTALFYPNDEIVNRILPNPFLQQQQQEEEQRSENYNEVVTLIEEEGNNEGGKRERERQLGLRRKEFTDLQHQYRNILDHQSSSFGSFSDSSSWMLLKSRYQHTNNQEGGLQEQQMHNRGRNAQQKEKNNTTAAVDDTNDDDQPKEQKSKPFNTNFILLYMVHAKGANVLTMEGLQRSQMVTDTIQQTPGYEDICKGVLYPGREDACFTLGVNTLWDTSIAELYGSNDFEELPNENGDNAPQSEIELLNKINNAGLIHDIPSYLGGVERDPETQNVISAKAFLQVSYIPYNTRHQSFADNLEKQLLEKLLTLKNQWKFEEDGNDFRYEGMTSNGIEDGLMNSIINDLPLIGAVFLVMITFTAIVFYKVDRVQSRSLLGLGGVVTIVLSLMSGFGVLFMIGIPFTPMTMVIPFLMFGVGLDDKFVILCAYNRTTSQNNNSDSYHKNYSNDMIGNFIMDRIRTTIEEVSISVVATTLSTTLSFLLGISTTIPAIKWVCYYAAPCVLFDFFYQMTFFIALVALDERRIQSNRVECSFVCFYDNKDKEQQQHDDIDIEMEDTSATFMESNTFSNMFENPLQKKTGHKKHQRRQRDIHKAEKAGRKGARNSHHQLLAEDKTAASRFMKWYSNKLMLTPVRYTVLFVFVSFFGFSLYRSSLMEQQFNASSMLPRSSPVNGYLKQMMEYSTRSVGPDIVFRYVDQSNPIVQDQMIDMIEQIRDIPGFGEDPPACWVVLYKEMMDQIPEMWQSRLQTMTIQEQIEFGKSMLPDRKAEFDAFELLFDKFVRFNDEGEIVASFCRIYVNDLNMESANDQMAIFKRIKEIERNHPMNIGMNNYNDYPFFTVEINWYPIWELFLKTLPELISTVLFAVIAVLFVGFMIIPHYSGIIFLIITLTLLLVDLVGVTQLIGVKINPISYIALVISIGLMVDYIVHVLIQYYESTRYIHPIDKVKHTLRTIGVSVLVGGLSTLLGFVPMLFSTANVFITFAYTVVPMILLSLLHGLIFLPVLLSFFGPSSPPRDGEGRIIHFDDDNSEKKEEQWREEQKYYEKSLPSNATFMEDTLDTDDALRLIEF